MKAGLTFAPDAAFLVSAGDQVDSSDKDKAVKEYDGFRSPQILKELPVAVNPGNYEAFIRQSVESTEAKGQTLYLTAASSTGSKYYGKSEEKLPYAAYIQADEEPWITVVTTDEGSLGLRTYRVKDGEVMDKYTIAR